MNRRQWGLIAAGAAGLLLSACGSSFSSAGAAANVGPDVIANSALSAQVADVQSQKGDPAGEPDAEMVQGTLRRIIITDLIEQAAAEQAITVSQGQVDAKIDDARTGMGGKEALEAAFLANGVPASEIEHQVRVSLMLDALGQKLLPDGDGQAQSTAVYDYVVKLAARVGVDVSPRYGTWDPTQLAVGPLPTDLSVPSADSLVALPGSDPSAP